MMGRKAKAVAEQPAEPYEVRRRKEVLADIERLKGEMSSLDLRTKLFREKNFVFLDGRSVWRLDGLTKLPAAEAELRALETERDELLRQWHQILAEHAALACVPGATIGGNNGKN